MALPINYLSLSQTKGTRITMKALMNLLSCASTRLCAKIRHHASVIILNVGSDGSCLSAPKSRSRAVSYF